MTHEEAVADLITLKKFFEEQNNAYPVSIEYAINELKKRKTGEWIWMGDKGDSRFMCSVCKSKEDVPTIMGKPIVWDYCPNCGANMKEGGSES